MVDIRVFGSIWEGFGVYFGRILSGRDRADGGITCIVTPSIPVYPAYPALPCLPALPILPPPKAA